MSLRRVLYKQIAGLPKSRHAQRRTGALSLRFVGDLSAARLWFGRGLPDVLTAIVVLPGAVAILASLDTALALAALTPLGLSMTLMTLLAWHLQHRHERLRARRASIAISMIERIVIAPELDLMGRTDKELSALDKQGEALRGDAVARRGRTAGLQAILQAGVALSGLAMFWTASRAATPPATVAASLSVLALVALPLQDFAASWDRYCAWSVARMKAKRLLDEPTMTRTAKPHGTPAAVRLSGSAQFTVEAGGVTRIITPNAAKQAQVIAGLDQDPDLYVEFDTERSHYAAFIGDAHIGLQGSLRRSTTLGARRRPNDKQIAKTLTALDLSNLMSRPGGLDQRISENGKGLTAHETMRLDLARAVLSKADLIVISSLRWAADPDRVSLLETLQDMTPATIILAEAGNNSTSCDDIEAL